MTDYGRKAAIHPRTVHQSGQLTVPVSRENRTDADRGRDGGGKVRPKVPETFACKPTYDGLAGANQPVPPACAAALLQETSAGGVWRCCQSNRNLSPIDAALPFPGMDQAMKFCHSASAAERRTL